MNTEIFNNKKAKSFIRILVSNKPAGLQYNEPKSIIIGYHDIRLRKEKVQEKYSPIIPNQISCEEIRGKSTNSTI